MRNFMHKNFSDCKTMCPNVPICFESWVQLRLVSQSIKAPNTNIAKPANRFNDCPNSFSLVTVKASTNRIAPARLKNNPIMKRRSLSFSMMNFLATNFHPFN